jgi:hypothetical protein
MEEEKDTRDEGQGQHLLPLEKQTQMKKETSRQVACSLWYQLTRTDNLSFEEVSGVFSPIRQKKTRSLIPKPDMSHHTTPTPHHTTHTTPHHTTPHHTTPHHTTPHHTTPHHTTLHHTTPHQTTPHHTTPHHTTPHHTTPHHTAPHHTIPLHLSLLFIIYLQSVIF